MNKIILDKNRLIEEFDNTKVRKKLFYFVMGLFVVLLLLLAMGYLIGNTRKTVVMFLTFLPSVLIFCCLLSFLMKENTKLKNLITEGNYNIYEDVVTEKKIKWYYKRIEHTLKFSSYKKTINVGPKLYKRASVGDACYIVKFENLCKLALEELVLLSNEYDLSPELREKIIHNK